MRGDSNCESAVGFSSASAAEASRAFAGDGQACAACAHVHYSFLSNEATINWSHNGKACPV